MKKLFLLLTAATVMYACNDRDAGNTTTGTDTSSNSTSTSSNDEDSKEERNKQTALASVNAFGNEGAVEKALANVDNDVMEYGDGSMDPVKGKDSVAKWMNMWIAAFPDYHGSDLMAVADGDYVMVYGTWTGTWKSDLMGMKATGKSFKLKDVDIFKFNDAGKIIEHRAVQSNSALAMQVGMPMNDATKKD